MNRNIARCLYGVLFAGGLTVLGATAANAADSTTGDDSILSGSVVDAVVSVPVTLNGTSVSVLGDATSSEASTPAPAAPAAPAPTTSGDHSVLGGTNVAPLVSIPVDLGGNAVSVVGDSFSSDSTTDAPEPAPAAAPAASETSGDDSVGGGTNVAPVVTVPVTVSGNSISLVGDSSSEDSSTAIGGPAPSAGTAGSGTSGNDGILGGTLVSPDATIPVTVGGNAISVVGDSSSTGSVTDVGTAPAAPAAGAGSSGDDGILGGTLVSPDATIPVTVGGNAISVVGDSSTEDSATGTGGSAPAAGAAGSGTSGNDGILGGTIVAPDASLPVTVGGNAISVVGDSSSTGSATDSGTAPVAPAAGDGTSGNDGILGGTVIAPVIEIPVTIGGNAISVIGDTDATDSATTVPGTPTSPVDSSAPVNPTDPATPVGPTTPVDETDPSVPSASATPTGAALTAATTLGTSGALETEVTSSALASSGAGEMGLFLGRSALLLLLGAAALVVARKRTALQ
jgi:hypothetical protein